MNAKILVTSILFSISFLPTMSTPAHALGCVNADVSTQVKVTGSKDAPGSQQNSVNQAIGPDCVGNSSVHKSNQVYVGAEGADQKRTSNQTTGGSAPNAAIPERLMDKGNVNFSVGKSKTIYTPALDPNFLPKH
jgi:hypothetical protein